MSKKQVIILGGGRGCIPTIEALLLLNEQNGGMYEIMGMLDDDAAKKGASIAGYKILGGLSLANEYPEALLCWGIGNPANPLIRIKISDKLNLAPQRFMKLVHRDSVVSRFAIIEEGITIYSHVMVGANAHLSKHVGVGTGCVVEHDVYLAPGVLLASGVLIAGNVSVGEGTYIGQGANIKEGIKIGKNAIIGMGAVVINDVTDNTTVVGNPAKALNKTI